MGFPFFYNRLWWYIFGLLVMFAFVASWCILNWYRCMCDWLLWWIGRGWIIENCL